MTTTIASQSGLEDGAAEEQTLGLGDTLTVVSGCLGGAWVVEDENGVVYLATAVE